MKQRRILGFVLGAAVLAAVVVPATADAQDDAAPLAEAVTVQAVDPADLSGAPTSSGGQVGTGETSPSSVVIPPAPGTPEPQIIIGNDGRTRETPTTQFPASAVALIIVDPVNPAYGSFSCTGWFYSPDAVATAAHCIEYDEQTAFYTVIPGRDGGSAPFPSCSNLDSVVSTNSWIDQNDGTERPPSGPARDDYAILELNQTLCDYGNDLGWFGFRQVADSKLEGKKETINGYPADKPSGEQWKSEGKIKSFNKYLVRYKNDTFAGVSGSPVYRNFNNCGTCAIGIHTFGKESQQFNAGTRIRPKVGKSLNRVDDNEGP